MSVREGMAALRGMIERNEDDKYEGSGYKCGFCDTDIYNGPVFFTDRESFPPVHFECLKDINSFPDLPKVIEWNKKMKGIEQ